jgi:hypothetical protein
MESDIHQKHGQSLFMPRHPVLRRERSYSLPPGLALMSAAEATMIFSAAERATSRRRMASMGASFAAARRPILDSGPNSSLPSPEAAPLTPQNAPADNTAEENRVTVEIDHQSNFFWGTDETPTKEDLQTTEPFPLFSASPTSPRRLATSPMLKTYADGIYEYTRSRLTTVAPRFRVDSVTSDDEDQTSAEPVSRPMLQSHFSDWTITTCGALSREGSQSMMPDPLDDVDSPYPFFDFDFFPPAPSEARPEVTYASSEALGSSSTLPLATPLSHPHAGDGEVSYFSNFEYLHESPKQPQRPSRQRKPVTFSLSPLPSPSDTATPGASDPYAESVDTGGGAVRDIGEESSTAFQTARLAVRVPNAMIGTI